MRVRIIAIGLLLFVCVSLFAQESDSNRISYSNITEWGSANISILPSFCYAYELTTIQGISIDKKYHIGLGTGIGGGFSSIGIYTPLFLNYRLYFKPDRKFSPHLNISMGVLIGEDFIGIRSAITSGFITRRFSFSSGFSFFVANGEFMPGITIKWGFVF